MRGFVAIVAMLFVAVSQASAATSTYYVNTNSTAGGDGTTNATTGTNRAFATLAEAENALQRTINVGDEVVIICDGTAADTAKVEIDGWTISGRLTIRAAAQHGGKWNTGIYRLEYTSVTTSERVLIINESNTTVDGIAVRGILGAGSIFAVITVNSNLANSTIKNNFLLAENGRALQIGNGSGIYYNNILYSYSNGALEFSGTGSGMKYVYHNTLYSATGVRAIIHNYAGTIPPNVISLQNNILVSTGFPIDAPYTDGFDSTTGYNVCNTPQGGIARYQLPGSNNKFSQTITFVDAANYDFRTSDTDALVDNSLFNDPVAPVTTDITGRARGSAGAVFAGAYEATRVHHMEEY